jgi:flavin-dependent dehydrogenase
MITSEVIIIGAGPAGSTCGWKLQQQGVECLILDKQKFPRTKLCAGWITPQVIKDLKLKVNQYSIRRYEFDDWLLQRSGVAYHLHEVKNITRDDDNYIIDGKFRCKYLIGAGGTYCPVYQTLFKQEHPRPKNLMIVSLEQEFAYDYQDANCHLWFVQNNLPGYSWYVPKGDGYLNIGIGGFAEKLKVNNDTIKNHWQLFVKKLERLSLVQNFTFNPRGYVYFIRDGLKTVQIDNVFLVGDAAGLATKDMGEGIGPAVKSGLLAAESIITGKPYAINSVKEYSFQRYRLLTKAINFILK